jgi:hypothetical protein
MPKRVPCLKTVAKALIRINVLEVRKARQHMPPGFA